MKFRPRLRTVLLIVNLAVLLLPLAGIAILAVYETELVLRTESELIGQGVLIAAAYSDVLARELKESEPTPAAKKDYGVPVASEWTWRHSPVKALNPIEPKLDLARDEVLPRAPDAIEPSNPPDEFAVAAGKRITPLLKTAKNVTLAGIRITDFRGVVVATTGSELGLSLLPRQEVRRALRGEPVSVLRTRVHVGPAPPMESISRRGRVRVFVAMPVISEGRVVGVVALSRTPLDLLKALYLNRHRLIGGAFALVGVVTLMAMITAFTISRPVKALIRQSERVSLGEMDAAVPLSHPGTYEVDLLSKAFAGMAVTLQNRAEYIRAFASNVSHAFKTPLTSVRGTVELFEDHFDTMSPEDRRRFLNILEKDTARLQRLVGRLLELAKAETVKPAAASTDPAVALESVAGHYFDIGLRISVEVAPGTPNVAMSRETFESIISTLLDNARQHGGEDAHVKIEVGTVILGTDRRVEIRVRDNGPGIPLAIADKIFDPFFTTASGSGGTGLGLSVAQALLEAHGGSIEIEDGGHGASFMIRLLVAEGMRHER